MPLNMRGLPRLGGLRSSESRMTCQASAFGTVWGSLSGSAGVWGVGPLLTLLESVELSVLQFHLKI